MAQLNRFRFVRYAVLTVAGVLLLAIVARAVTGLKVRRQIARGVVARAIQSVQLKKKLGEPVQMGYLVRGRVIGGMDGGTADLTIPVSGPRATGRLVDWSQGGFAGWRVCSLEFRSDDGSTILIVADETSTCDRE